MVSQTGLWGTGAPTDPIAWGHRLLDIAVRRHKPVAVYGLMSGGHDSLMATHMASQHPAFTGAVHVNTGIGVEETRKFVRRVCREQGWPLMEYCATEQGQDYDDLIMEHGFPGPFHHTKMYNRLKERALEALMRDTKTHRLDRVMLVTGVRRAESRRRMGTVQPINRQGSKLWVAPLTWVDGTAKNAYITEHGLPRNEVVDLLHMSGECLCGAYAKPGELEWLEYCGFSEVVQRIRNLEERARQAGVPRCKWGAGGEVQESATNEQLMAPGFMCVGCEA